MKQSLILLGFLFCVLQVVLIRIPSLLAEDLRELGIPDELVAWVSWVKSEHPEWNCASLNGGFECVWPGVLNIDARDKGAEFEILAELMADGNLPLPGSEDLPPQQIKVTNFDGEEVNYRLLTKGKQLWLSLKKGEYKVKGRFIWSNTPKYLPVPDSFGLVFDSSKANQIFKRGSGIAWKGQDAKQQFASDINVSVARRISDGSPVKIETVLNFKVSGEARPLQFGNVLPIGATPISVKSDLPLQLSKEGELSIQIRPGSYVISIVSLMPQPLSAIRAPHPKLDFWPQSESWLWISNPALRSVEIKGGAPINPELAELPAGWGEGAVYKVDSDAEIQINEIKRGLLKPDNNALSASREFWLDLDGNALTVVDDINGSMQTGFRLNALPDMQLGRVTINGKPALITNDADSGIPGVELRSSNVALRAVSRLSGLNDVSATGWQSELGVVRGGLNLSPAWSLIHISGVDKAYGSWVESWTLLDFFILLLLVIASYRLLGVLVASIVAVTLLINHAEFLEPRLVLVHLLLAFAVFRLTDKESTYWHKLSRFYLLTTFGLWALMGLTFSKLQITQFLFPQLAAGTRYRTLLQNILLTFEQHFLIWPVVFVILAIAFKGGEWWLDSKGWWARAWRAGALALLGILSLSFLSSTMFFLYTSNSGSYNQYRQASESLQGNEYSEPMMTAKSRAPMDLEKEAGTASLEDQLVEEQSGKLVQSGPAEPIWHWKRMSFTISGPVSPGRKISFFVLSPTFVRLLSLIRVILLAFLGLKFLAAFGVKLPKAAFVGSSVSIFVGFFLVFLLASPAVRADIPDEKILQSLEKKLENQVCRENSCSAIENMRIIAKGKSLEMSFKVSSKGASALALPGPISELPIFSVSVDGVETKTLRRSSNDFLWVKVPDGLSRVQAFANVDAHQVLSIQFPMSPLSVGLDSQDWELDGVLPTGAVEKGIRLVPKQGRSDTTSFKETKLPNWFIVKRKLYLGESHRILTEVERMGDYSYSSLVRFPLVQGEKLLSGPAEVENSFVVARFLGGESKLVLNSVIDWSDALSLKAQAGKDISELWTLECSPYARCEVEGLPASSWILNQKQVWSWSPFPEESVDISLKLLEAAPGELVTVDSVQQLVEIGVSGVEATLSGRVRSSRQDSLNIDLPEGARVESSELDGVTGQFIRANGRSSFLIDPGEHSFSLTYRLDEQQRYFWEAPSVKLGLPVNNVTLKVRPNHERWLLWVGGPQWGPGVLYWVKILVVAAFCICLAWAGLLPTSLVSAGILGLGIASLAIVELVVPLTWLLVLKLLVDKKLPLKMKATAKNALFLLLTVLGLTFFYEAVSIGLLAEPPMLIVGNQSTSNMLVWYVDRATGALPTGWILSLPMWCWRAFMLVWSTWMAVLIVQWLGLSIRVFREKES